MVLNFMLTSDENWSSKNDQKPLSKFLKNRICKLKQYLSYILMITNQNILAILSMFQNLQNIFMKHITRRRQIPKLLPLNVLPKFLIEKKY